MRHDDAVLVRKNSLKKLSYPFAYSNFLHYTQLALENSRSLHISFITYVINQYFGQFSVGHLANIQLKALVVLGVYEIIKSAMMLSIFFIKVAILPNFDKNKRLRLEA